MSYIDPSEPLSARDKYVEAKSDEILNEIDLWAANVEKTIWLMLAAYPLGKDAIEGTDMPGYADNFIDNLKDFVESRQDYIPQLVEEGKL